MWGISSLFLIYVKYKNTFLQRIEVYSSVDEFEWIKAEYINFHCGWRLKIENEIHGEHGYSRRTHVIILVYKLENFFYERKVILEIPLGLYAPRAVWNGLTDIQRLWPIRWHSDSGFTECHPSIGGGGWGVDQN